MKAFIVLALCVAGACAGGYGYGATRVLEQPAYTSRVLIEEAPAPVIRTAAYAAEPVVFKSAGYGGYGSAAVLAEHIPITRFDHSIQGGMSDAVSFDSGNGIRVNDETHIKGYGTTRVLDSYGNVVESDALLAKSGSFSYISPEGIPITTNWVADENGFHAEGAHLPTPPPMPLELIDAYNKAAVVVADAGYGYSAPAVRTLSYDAPAVFTTSSYAAPAIRTAAYAAPAIVRSAY